MTRVFYGRVSTDKQNLDLQMAAAKAWAADKIFVEKKGGGDRGRAELKKALAFVRAGDTLGVWKLDRLARSLPHLLQIAAELDESGVTLHCTSTGMTFERRTAMGKMMFNTLATFAEFEKDINRERTMEGLASARRQGRVGGRPKAMTSEQIAEAKKLRDDDQKTMPQIAAHFDLAPSTLRKYLNQEAS